MSQARGDAYVECRLASARPAAATALAPTDEPTGGGADGGADGFACGGPAVDAALGHPRLVRGLSADSAGSAYEAMDLLAQRPGVAWEDDCHLNVLLYRLLALALAPPFRLRDAFAAAALRRDVALVLGRGASAAATPQQWRRLAVGVHLLAARAAEDGAAILLEGLAERWLQAIAGRADIEDILYYIIYIYVYVCVYIYIYVL